MTHPITPPPELIEDWIEIAKPEPWKRPPDPNVLCALAAQWGADQELEACCEWLLIENNQPCSSNVMRAARRPKPPSLKEQAQAELDRLIALIPTEGAIAMVEPIRRALKQLDD
jgi:hypothetical protein